jgi:hypothetical protein
VNAEQWSFIMMHKASVVLAASLLAAGLGATPALADACSHHSHTGGTILGAAGGGLIGNAVTHGSAVGTVGGAVAGGFAGNAIARSGDCHVDRDGRAYYYDHHHHRRYYRDEERRDRDEDRDYEDEHPH